jgi:hypothetical protein
LIAAIRASIFARTVASPVAICGTGSREGLAVGFQGPTVPQSVKGGIAPWDVGAEAKRPRHGRAVRPQAGFGCPGG